MVTRLSGEDVQRLTEIVDWIEEILKMVVNDRDARFLRSSRYQPPGFSRQMDLAWNRNQERLSEIRHILVRASEEATDSATLGPGTELVIQQLQQHGLTGDDLKPKHSMIGWLFQRFQQSRTLLWLKRLLAAANSVLDSLGVAIPQAAAVGEFKDFLELGLRE
jgi:hypothetical protein